MQYTTHRHIHRTNTPTLKPTAEPQNGFTTAPSHTNHREEHQERVKNGANMLTNLTSESLNYWGVKQSRVKDGRDTHGHSNLA